MIDLKKLRESKGYELEVFIKDRETGMRMQVDAEKLQSIYAIPIDWLKKKYPLTGVYGTESYFRKAHIVDELIKEWEAEKEV